MAKLTMDMSLTEVRAARNPTRKGLSLCVQWLDACEELGWGDDDMPGLEKLFWVYRDADGNTHPPQAKG